MNIPAHRAAAVAPTPADTFATTEDGKTIINLTELERAARAAAEQAEREKTQAEAEPEPDATPPAEMSPKPAKPAGSVKATTQTKEA
ncbi:hypothetical protein [Azospirillum argentinense]|uniref:Uncharacterized protein n=1 Tax=Azospirillum brasilense TaxID=192 RepID=A0A4D8Q5Y2_AZOBR|nr:hypothetical protein [Azospirillum argentinense]QCO05448.1 hypothetical protein D3867_26240 [Azospirillum argentinense]